MADSGIRQDNALLDTWQDADGQHRQVVHLKAPRGAARRSVASAITSAELLPDSATRNRFTVFNESTANLFIGYGTVAVTATDYTHKIAGGGYFEYEFGGPVQCVWDAANGFARVTEVSP